MGGNLTLVSSVEGVGSKFSILIPILQRVEIVEEDDESELSDEEEDDEGTFQGSSSFDENDASLLNSIERERL